MFRYDVTYMIYTYHCQPVSGFWRIRFAEAARTVHELKYLIDSRNHRGSIMPKYKF